MDGEMQEAVDEEKSKEITQSKWLLINKLSSTDVHCTVKHYWEGYKNLEQGDIFSEQYT